MPPVVVVQATGIDIQAGLAVRDLDGHADGFGALGGTMFDWRVGDRIGHLDTRFQTATRIIGLTAQRLLSFGGWPRRLR